MIQLTLFAPAAPTLEIRLAGSDRQSAMEGRVEVNYNSGGWGTICDDLWGIEDADVACRMLNYKSASSFTKRASFGEGSGIIWLDNVACKGDESSLLLCSHFGIAKHNCRHSEDAGVVCSSELLVSCNTYSILIGFSGNWISHTVLFVLHGVL